MTNINNDPIMLFNSLLEKGGRPLKIKNLHAIQELCQEVYQAGSRDFQLASIGKLCEKKGILTARGLYNAAQADYRALIRAWELYSGPLPPKRPKPLATEEYIQRIEDPAIRTLVQTIISERNRLKSELNTLKASTFIVVDKRPPPSQPINGTKAAIGALTDSERRALNKAISKEFLEAHGWKEANFGEIVNERGRTVYDPGYATALRKALAE